MNEFFGIGVAFGLSCEWHKPRAISANKHFHTKAIRGV